MRNARGEAAARVGHRFDVRVLEPSPPYVDAPPYFADDPTDGGEVLPIQRDGARTWESLCEDDEGLRKWCEDRWLIRRALSPLPATFVETRAALHEVAEQVIAPARQAVNGKIGLRFTYHGFGTPYFGNNRQVRVEDGDLIDGSHRSSIDDVDPAAALALGDWYGFCASLLEQLRADGKAASRVQLWPEHFDMAVTIGEVTYGGSPGDETHAEPYLYVAPFEPRQGDFWNESFGASLPYQSLLDGADPLTFFHQAQAKLH